MEAIAFPQPTPPIEIVIAEDNGVSSRVILRGELDIGSSEGLPESLSALAHGKLVVDLSELTFIDSCGVGSLVRAKKQIEANRNRFVLVNPSRSVQRIFEVLSLERLFDDEP